MVSSLYVVATANSINTNTMDLMVEQTKTELSRRLMVAGVLAHMGHKDVAPEDIVELVDTWKEALCLQVIDC